MILEKLIEMLKDIMIGYDIDFNLIDMDTRLVDDLGMNSISMLLMSIAIEDEWGIAISTTDANKLVFVKDIYNLINDFNNK